MGAHGKLGIVKKISTPVVNRELLGLHENVIDATSGRFYNGKKEPRHTGFGKRGGDMC